MSPENILSAVLFSQSDSHDIPGRIPSKSDSQFDFKLNFEGNSVSALVRLRHIVTNTGTVLR